MQPEPRRLLDLVLFKTYADLKYESRRTYAGVLWWLVEPIIFMVIFYFVFAVVFQRGTEHYVPFLLIGLTAWHWVQSSIMQACTSISSNQSLLQQVHVPKFVFPTVLILSTSVKFLIVFAILLTYLIVYGIEVSWSWLYSLVVLGNLLLLLSGMAFVVAAIAPMIPDIRILVENALRAVFFLSGIFYDIRELPPHLAQWLQWNPFALLLSDLRAALMYQEAPIWPAHALIALCALGLLAAGLLLMRRYELQYAKISI